MNPAVEYFTDESGTEKVVLSRDEYEQILEALEDAEDTQAFDEAQKILEGGDGELLPIEFADVLNETDSLLREWRKYRGLTQTELSGLSGVRQATISDYERGTRPTLDNARALARALNLDADDLF